MTSKIFVGHLSEQTTEEALRTVFEQFGEVKQLDLRTGFAFVLFGSEEEAQRAIEAMHDKELDGNRIRVEKERGSAEGGFRERVKPPKRLDLRLVVRGLHPKVDWKDLKDWARETVGEVTYSNVFDRDGQHMGLIELKDEASVERALTELCEVPLLGVKVTLERDAPDSEYSRIPPSGVSGSFHGGRGGYGGRGGFGGRGGGAGRGNGDRSNGDHYYADRGGDRYPRGGDRYPRDNFGGARDPRDRDYGGRGYYAQQAPPSSHGRDSRDREPPRDSRDHYYRGAGDRDPRGRRDSRDTRGGDRYGAPLHHAAPHHAPAYNNYDAPPRRYGDDVGYAPPHRDRSRSRSRDRGSYAPPAGATSNSNSNSHSNGRGGRYYDGPRR